MSKPPWLDDWRFTGPNHTLSVMNVFKIDLDDNVPDVNSAMDKAYATNDDLRTHSPSDFMTDNGHLQKEDISTASAVAFVDSSSELMTTTEMNLSVQDIVYMTIIIAITVLLIVSSVLMITVIITSTVLKDVIGYYLISLAVCDLLCGTLITPISVYAIIDSSWHFEHSEIVCRFEAYIELVLLSVTLYIFIWISVDRYIAVMRPSRYDSEQTFNRSRCWVMFSWITSLLLCCPILFSDMQVRYEKNSFLCVLDYSKMLPYASTMFGLVVMPSIGCISYTYNCIFNQLQHLDNFDDCYKVQIQSDRSFMTTFLIIVTFLLCWMPLVIVILVEGVFGVCFQWQALYFATAWLAISGGSWKLLVCFAINQKFRHCFKNFLVCSSAIEVE